MLIQYSAAVNPRGTFGRQCIDLVLYIFNVLQLSLSSLFCIDSSCQHSCNIPFVTAWCVSCFEVHTRLVSVPAPKCLQHPWSCTRVSNYSPAPGFAVSQPCIYTPPWFPFSPSALSFFILVFIAFQHFFLVLVFLVFDLALSPGLWIFADSLPVIVSLIQTLPLWTIPWVLSLSLRPNFWSTQEC